MLIAMFILLMRKLNRKYSVLSRLKSLKGNRLKAKIVFVSLLFFLKMSSNAQSQTLSFEVRKNNSHIGNISITKRINSDTVVYDLFSKIKAKIILSFNVTGIEKTIYKHGLLIYSSVYRKLNAKEKVNKELHFNAGKYRLVNSGRISTLPVSKINTNLVLLYFNEPVNISQVYCDNQNSMANIVLIETGKYRVTFPDGSYNIFYYQNGKCKKVDVFASLYEVQLISTL